MPGSIIARLSRIGAAGALVLMFVFTGGSAGGQGTSGLSDDVPVALILDASRSMLDEVEGRRRMDVARDAMLQIAPGPLTQRRASLVSFGNDRVNECDNIPIIHPFGSDDVRSTLDAIQALEPAEPGEGEESLFGSPLYRALEVAMDTLPAEAEEASIVMVTDGIDACDRNICELVPTLQDRGITVNILAIDVDPVLLGQLACVPAGTGGALLPSDNLTSISSYVSLLSRAAQGESVDLQPYIDDAERLRAELSTMREERDALDRLGQSLDADLLRVFGELDEARIRVRSLEAVLANAEDQNAEQVNGLEAQIADAQGRIAALQDRILALDAAVTRCDQEKAALEQQLALALGRTAELESLEPVEVVKEVTVIQVEADPKVVADLETAKQALAALGCPFESLDACEPINQDREVALLAEIDALRDDARVRQGALETIANERDRIEAGWEQSEKRLHRMIDGLALTATAYETALNDDFNWQGQVASHEAAGRGMASVRANRQLMALVSRRQQVQIIEADTSGLKEQVDSLTAQRDAMEGRLAEILDERNGFRASLAAMTDERDTMQSERDGLARRVEQLTQRAALFVDERDAAVELSEERLGEILRLTEVMQTLNGELSDTVASFNEAEAARASLAIENQGLNQQIEADADQKQGLNDEIEALRSALTAVQAERDEARADRVHLLEEVSRLDITVETVLSKNVTLQTQIDAALQQAEVDRSQAEQAIADKDAALEQWDRVKLELSTAQEQHKILTEKVDGLLTSLEQRDAQIAASGETNRDLDQENRSLMAFVDGLEGELNDREVALRESERQLEETRASLARVTDQSAANQAFFDLFVGKCTALMGWEGGAEEDVDRQTLAYECAAAFESARRWRADLTEMVDLRDRSLQACEARQAALEAQSCALLPSDD